MKAIARAAAYVLKRVTPIALLAVVCCLRSLPAAELDAAKLADIAPAMQKFVDQKELAGAVTVVGRHDKVVATAAVGCQNLADKTPMQADTLFRIASMTKPITAVGVMILVDEGKLKIDDPVEKHLPEFRGQKLRTKDADGGTRLVEPARLVTIRDLMTHTSGMAGGLPREPAGLYVKRDHTLADAVKLFAKEPLDFQPGAKWQYCNIGIDTLGRLVEVGFRRAVRDLHAEAGLRSAGHERHHVLPHARAGQAAGRDLRRREGRTGGLQGGHHRRGARREVSDPGRRPVLDRPGPRPLLPHDAQPGARSTASGSSRPRASRR